MHYEREILNPMINHAQVMRMKKPKHILLKKKYWKSVLCLFDT